MGTLRSGPASSALSKHQHQPHLGSACSALSKHQQVRLVGSASSALSKHRSLASALPQPPPAPDCQLVRSLASALPQPPPAPDCQRLRSLASALPHLRSESRPAPPPDCQPPPRHLVPAFKLVVALVVAPLGKRLQVGSVALRSVLLLSRRKRATKPEARGGRSNSIPKKEEGIIVVRTAPGLAERRRISYRSTHRGPCERPQRLQRIAVRSRDD